MIETLKKNIKNRAWWIALISALIILGKTWGIDLTDYIGKDWQNTIKTICTIAILLGISVDTTSQNIGGTTNEVIQEIPQSEDNTTVEPESFHGAKKEQLQSLVQQINTIINE
jgi:phi LC3 family holin